MRIVWLLLGFLIFTSCSSDDILSDPQWGPESLISQPKVATTLQSNITMELDGRLPKDSNGYYHLTLNQSTNQTTHRVSGKVLNTKDVTKLDNKGKLIKPEDDDSVKTFTESYDYQIKDKYGNTIQVNGKNTTQLKYTDLVNADTNFDMNRLTSAGNVTSTSLTNFEYCSLNGMTNFLGSIFNFADPFLSTNRIKFLPFPGT